MANNSEPQLDVWIVEDDRLFLDELLELLQTWFPENQQKGFGDCESLLKLLKKKDGWLPPEVIILDINLPGISGIEAISKIKASLPDTKIVMLTIEEKPEYIGKALSAGASGYLAKDADAETIFSSIVSAAQGGLHMPPKIAQYIFNSFATGKDYKLTRREREILKEMVNGKSQKEIANELFISPTTVNSHIQNIYGKLHVRSGTEAVSKALRERII